MKMAIDIMQLVAFSTMAAAAVYLIMSAHRSEKKLRVLEAQKDTELRIAKAKFLETMEVIKAEAMRPLDIEHRIQ